LASKSAKFRVRQIKGNTTLSDYFVKRKTEPSGFAKKKEIYLTWLFKGIIKTYYLLTKLHTLMIRFFNMDAST
jgi:hypothetical protein